MASLQLDNLGFGHNNRMLSRPLSLEARSGEFWAILGRTVPARAP